MLKGRGRIGPQLGPSYEGDYLYTASSMKIVTSEFSSGDGALVVSSTCPSLGDARRNFALVAQGQGIFSEGAGAAASCTYPFSGENL